MSSRRSLRTVAAQGRQAWVQVDEAGGSLTPEATRCYVRRLREAFPDLPTIAEAGVPLGEYSPLSVKTSVVGYGRARAHLGQGGSTSALVASLSCG